ncbi:MAG TPA: beta-eliminating lyase-related protein, partial [Steroidobacteraceae bacterium]|nr:beta-eliminating lyase-related protein [Steroidobacteraceae bacterium]
PMKFLSDNTAPASAEVIAAVTAANTGYARAYGDDDWTRQLDDAFGRYFGTPVRAFPVASGTAANSLALATLTPPYGAIFAADEAHVIADECGACELQSGGARLMPVTAPEGRMDPEALAAALADHPLSVHSVQPAAVTITQASEYGTVYSVAQVAALAKIAHGHKLSLHMDGARFVNALAHLEVTPAAITWQAGVDVLSFGATKNGALDAEAVVFFDPQRAADFELRRKRAGHLLSKMRYVSAQLLACLSGEFFLANAQRANRLAQRIGKAAGPRLLYPVQANEVFLAFQGDERELLRKRGFEFYDWGPPVQLSARFVVSWDQPEADVDALCEALKR